MLLPLEHFLLSFLYRCRIWIRAVQQFNFRCSVQRNEFQNFFDRHFTFNDMRHYFFSFFLTLALAFDSAWPSPPSTLLMAYKDLLWASSAVERVSCWLCLMDSISAARCPIYQAPEATMPRITKQRVITLAFQPHPRGLSGSAIRTPSQMKTRTFLLISPLSA